MTKSTFDRGALTLKAYLRLPPLSTRDLYRLYDRDRPSLKTRKTPLADLVKAPLPRELAAWGPMRSSRAMVEAGRLLEAQSSVESGEDARLRATLELLDALCDARPEVLKVLRSVVLPAVRTLGHARERNDPQTIARLERFLLRLSGSAPAIIVSGIVVAGNPRYRGVPTKRRKGTGKQRSKESMAGRIRRAAAELEKEFIAPARQQLAREGYKPMVDRLDLIMRAIEAVVTAASSPLGSGARSALRAARRSP